VTTSADVERFILRRIFKREELAGAWGRKPFIISLKKKWEKLFLKTLSRGACWPVGSSTCWFAAGYPSTYTGDRSIEQRTFWLNVIIILM
jgi:hypothetical protein